MRSISRQYLKELPNKWNKYCTTNETRATEVKLRRQQGKVDGGMLETI